MDHVKGKIMPTSPLFKISCQLEHAASHHSEFMIASVDSSTAFTRKGDPIAALIALSAVPLTPVLAPATDPAVPAAVRFQPLIVKAEREVVGHDDILVACES